MAMIADAFISRFTDLLGKLVEEKVDLLLGVPNEIEKLQRTLRTIKNVIVDAERRRIYDEAINDWIMELKDVMYDGDDILDLCQIEAKKNGGSANAFTASWENCLCPRLSNHSPSTMWEQFLLPLLTCFQKTVVTHDIGSRIEDLNDRLEEITKRNSQFHLGLNTPKDHCKKTSAISCQTSSIVEPDIVGSNIEEDTHSLVKLLIAQDTRENVHVANVRVLAILGLGGVGKTTLAQKIFDDQKIEDNFQKKMWVCVSQEFSEIELLKEIITAGGGHVHDGANSRSQLELLVKEQLRGKKFLLILDDIWVAKVWDGLLRKPLESGAAGSRVLITTRKEGVARQMKAMHCHHVAKLSSEDGWALLCRKVDLSPSEILSLKDIGMEIVSKCDGLPLAIKAIGGVLCMKNGTRNAWETVLHNSAWSITGLPEEVQAALYLSYEDLPAHLKQCFLYCSLFPEDRAIYKLRVIRRWISEGIVKVQGSSLSPEEVGEEYYTALIMRNLLLVDPKWYDQGGCKMHDLLRSLAQYLTRDESKNFSKICGIKGGGSMGRMKLRRVSITDKEMTEVPIALTKQDTVRTLTADGCWIYKVDTVIDNLFRLRVLSLRGTLITNLPDSLGNLVHLRYLDLSWSKISMIPQTIGSLSNLEYLLVFGCESLGALPNSVVNLQSLRALDVGRTMLDGLPSGLGSLEHLCALEGFMPSGNSAVGCCTLEELQNLSQLSRLKLDRLERASSSAEAKGAALHNKPKLVRLFLCSNSIPQQTEEAIQKIKEVFEELCPPPCLVKLEIDGYFGKEFPAWMTMGTPSSMLNVSNLRRLDLKSCKNCEQLPPLGLYPNLDLLCIHHAESVEKIEHEFLQGGSCSGFRKLEELQFKHMPNWEEWAWESGVQAMPNLKKLVLSSCPKLMSLPEGLLCHATALTSLSIEDCDTLIAVENLPLKELDIKRNPSLARVSNLPFLQILIVKDCPALQVMENLSDLRRMELANCKMKTLPQYISEGAITVELKSLVIHCSESLLKNLFLMDGCPEWPKIKQFQRASIYSRNKSLYLHYTKTPFSVITNLNITTISSKDPSAY